jgi:hypothetical protein
MIQKRVSFNDEGVARACYAEKQAQGKKVIWGRRPFEFVVYWWEEEGHVLDEHGDTKHDVREVFVSVSSRQSTLDFGR